MGKRKKKQDPVMDNIVLPEDNSQESVREPDLELKSTQMLSPVMDICDGIVVTKDERYVQIMEVEPINFMLFPDEEQDAIADAFGASMIAFPSRFQIKILSRQASVEAHVSNYQKAMAKETNAKCSSTAFKRSVKTECTA